MRRLAPAGRRGRPPAAASRRRLPSVILAARRNQVVPQVMPGHLAAGRPAGAVPGGTAEQPERTGVAGVRRGE